MKQVLVICAVAVAAALAVFWVNQATAQSEVEGYFKSPKRFVPRSQSEIEEYFKPVVTGPRRKFVLDKYGRSQYTAHAIVHFDTDKATIRPESRPLLDEWGRALRGSLWHGIFIVEGHTDGQGTAEYNQKLSERRAMEVSNYLVQVHNIDPRRLLPRGYGFRFPVAPNSTPSGRAANRRVQFTLVDWID